MGTRSPLRTVALGDLHGSLRAFRTILTAAGLIDGDAWRGGRSILVQLGDVIDRGPRSVETYEFLADLQSRAKRGKGEVVRLLGNHEVSLLEGDFGLADIPHPEKMAERIRTDVLAGKVHAAYSHAGWFFSHAGITYPLLQRLRSDMRAESETRKRFTLRRLTAHINARFVDAVAHGVFTHPMFAVGHARGGDRELGGLFWSDFDMEQEAPRRAPRIHQVFGHTPEGYEGARFRSSTDGRRINVDIGIAEDYGGNLGYLEIVGREAIAHYLEPDGERVESMGVAPRARSRKPVEPAP